MDMLHIAQQTSYVREYKLYNNTDKFTDSLHMLCCC